MLSFRVRTVSFVASRRIAAGLVAAAVVLPQATPAAAQPPAPPTAATAQPPVPDASAPQPPPAPARVLTLEDALALAEAGNEQVVIAEAGVARARGGEARARSERLPQLSGSASYDRTIKSEFEGIFDAGSFGDGSDGFADLPFGQANVYRLGLSFSQPLYTGGRIRAQEAQARLSRENAAHTLTSTRAQLALDVAQAFYDAALADRYVTIAEETYAQADRSFQQTRTQREAGRVSEFELLRAQVDRDTLQPQVVRSRATREVAYLRLKQLIDLPLAAPLQLSANLDDARPAPAARFAGALAEAEAAAGPAPRLRLAITQAENGVRAGEEGVIVAGSQRRPAVAVNSLYGLVNYPSRLPAFDDWRTNWTVGLAVTLPLLTGGRIKADEAMAKADVDEARARLQLTRELSDLDAASARSDLRAARAEWEASAGTIDQAARAYTIAELRFREGLSTQLELSDSRLLLAQAQVNRARAARDLQIARVRYALLPDLPLGGGAATATGAGASTAQTAQTPQTPPTGGASTASQSTSAQAAGATQGVR
jgi:outer membrane protein